MKPPLFLILFFVASCAYGQDTLLFFQAEWCGPCQAMASIMHRIEHTKVDVDKEPVLVKLHKIVAMPAFVMLRDGKEIGRKVGTDGIEEMKEWVKAVSSGSGEGLLVKTKEREQ